MFRAAFTSRSWRTPHSPHAHALTPRSAIPFGLSLGCAPQFEQVWVVYASFTSLKTVPACSHLYSSIVFNWCQPASRTDLAILVFASFEALTLPTTIVPY